MDYKRAVPPLPRSSLEQLTLQERHIALKKFVHPHHQKPTQQDLISLVRPLGLFVINTTLGEKYEHCAIRAQKFLWKDIEQEPGEGKAFPGRTRSHILTVEGCLLYLFHIEGWPPSLKIARMCESEGCKNPYHHQTVALDFDLEAWEKRRDDYSGLTGTTIPEEVKKDVWITADNYDPIKNPITF